MYKASAFDNIPIYVLLAIRLVSPAWCIISREHRPGHFQSKVICGGHTDNCEVNHAPGTDNETLVNLTDTTTRKLRDAAAFIGEIVDLYTDERVKFTYSGLQPIVNCLDVVFNLTTRVNSNNEQEFVAHSYHDVLRIISVIQFITSEEKEMSPEFEGSRLHNKIKTLKNLLYEALCSMNKALRKLGHRGDEICRQVYIQQISDVCSFTSNLDRYVRDLELFRWLRSVSRTLFDRFYSEQNCPGAVAAIASFL